MLCTHDGLGVQSNRIYSVFNLESNSGNYKALSVSVYTSVCTQPMIQGCFNRSSRMTQDCIKESSRTPQ